VAFRQTFLDFLSFAETGESNTYVISDALAE